MHSKCKPEPNIFRPIFLMQVSLGNKKIVDLENQIFLKTLALSY